MSELIHIISHDGEFEGFIGSNTAVLSWFRRIRQVVVVSVLDGITTPLDWVQQHLPIGNTCLAVGPKPDVPIVYHHVYPLPDGWCPEGPLYPTDAVSVVTEMTFYDQRFSPNVHHAVHEFLFL